MKNYSLVVTFLMLLAACAGTAPNSGESLTPEKLKENNTPTSFTIDATKDTTLFGEKGTRIFISSNTFQYADGTPVTEAVTIRLEEYYSKTEIVLADLSTVAGGELLESGGMLNITAEADGKAVEISAGKELVVHFPKKSVQKEGMQLFYAGEGSTANAVVDWELDQYGNTLQPTLTLGNYAWQYPAKDDSTEYNFQPKEMDDQDVYYWNPIDFYVKSFDWSTQAIEEISSTENKTEVFNEEKPHAFDHWNTRGIECEMKISTDGDIKSIRIHTPLSDSTRAEVVRFLNDIPQLEPGVNKEGEIIERKGYLLITPGRPVERYEKREEYIKSFDEKYAVFENSPITNMDKAEAEYYIFNVTQLGWINCDRFQYLDEEEKVNLYVDFEVDEDVEFKMIFPKINSVLKASIEEGSYVFPNVAKGEWVTIFGMKTTNGQIQTFFKKQLITDQKVKDVSFEETTLKELKEALNKL